MDCSRGNSTCLSSAWLRPLLCAGLFLFGGCASDDDDDDGEALSLSGGWLVEEKSTDNCSKSTAVELSKEYYVVDDQGAKLNVTAYPGGLSFTATRTGSTITWHQEHQDNGGMVAIDTSVGIASGGDTITGGADWTWSNGSTSCSGHTDVTATRCLASTVDFSGVWEGTWDSTLASYSGDFTADVTQTDNLLAGTIAVPFIGMNDGELWGVVCASEVTFGDIDQDILFSGTVAAEGVSSSGNYNASAYGDWGTWQGIRTGEPTLSFSVVSQFDIAENWYKDLAFVAGQLWTLGDYSIYGYDLQGNLTHTLAAPGDYPSGLSEDGTFLIAGDNGWGTGQIYRLNPDAIIIEAPDSASLSGLAFDGTDLWALDSSPAEGCKLYRISLEGALLSTVDCTGEMPAGLAYDGTALWYGAFDMTNGTPEIIQVDTTGAFLSSFVTPHSSLIRGLTFDGQYLFAASQDSIIYKLTLTGSEVAEFSAPGESPQDLAFDGAHLWATDGQYSISGTIYELNPTDGTVLSSTPAPGDSPGGLTFAGDTLWSADTITGLIYQVSSDGISVIGTFPNFDLDCLTYNGTGFVAAESYTTTVNLFDTTGAIVSSFEVAEDSGESIGGLDYDGENYWIVTNMFSEATKIYQISSLGEILATYTASTTLPEAVGLAHDDTSLWLLGYDIFNNESRVYQLGLSE